MENGSVDGYASQYAKKADKSFWLTSALVDQRTNEARATYLLIITEMGVFQNMKQSLAAL